MAIVKRSFEELEEDLARHRKELDKGITSNDFIIIEKNISDIERIRDELYFRKQNMRK